MSVSRGGQAPMQPHNSKHCLKKQKLELEKADITKTPPPQEQNSTQQKTDQSDLTKTTQEDQNGTKQKTDQFDLTKTPQQEQNVTKQTQNATSTDDVTPVVVSKRQIKRQQRHARWLEGKAERRRKQREKERTKRALGVVSSGPSRKALKHITMSTSSCRQRVVLDMSLEEHMDDRRLGQCLRQIGRCYSANRRAVRPLQLYVTSFGGRSETVMSQQAAYGNWDVNFKPKHYLDEFQKSDIVYLTSESPNVLEKLDDTKVYIIGGLVDYNRLKGHCFSLSREPGCDDCQFASRTVFGDANEEGVDD
ncbi:tRNA methyltransferase 10 A [Chionoecetes opilio]|uniref:tRNA (guanine(9)-N(1))-methyltransferase n=1 Tax=Chionoecetes opilio TaxID=41210 RepID=A0A8J4Y5W1_CHIOP|nr:tRNA methyltransferase 10 A [Chionoecetes opilio]